MLIFNPFGIKKVAMPVSNGEVWFQQLEPELFVWGDAECVAKRIRIGNRAFASMPVNMYRVALKAASVI